MLRQPSPGEEHLLFGLPLLERPAQIFLMMEHEAAAFRRCRL